MLLIDNSSPPFGNVSSIDSPTVTVAVAVLLFKLPSVAPYVNVSVPENPELGKYST